MELVSVAESSYQPDYQPVSSNQTAATTATFIDIFTATTITSSTKRGINSSKDFTKQSPSNIKSHSQQLTFTFRKSQFSATTLYRHHVTRKIIGFLRLWHEVETTKLVNIAVHHALSILSHCVN